jgi:hypothetical protein
MVVITFHAAILFGVFWGSNLNPQPPTSWGQTWDQYAIFAIFCFYTYVMFDPSKVHPYYILTQTVSIEMICRIIVYGFFFNPPAVVLDGETATTTEIGEKGAIAKDEMDAATYAHKAPNAYLRHSWNRVDFLSVLGYWVDMILLLAHQEIVGDYQRILVFKMLSALRLLRLLNITNGNKIILSSLKRAAPLLTNVMFFVCFFFVIFG